jgi:Ni,Fe-hydrogenase I cytochrome b subunit
MFGWLKDNRRTRRIGHWFGWLALVLVLLTLLTGYGITQFRVVGSLTFGFFGKAFSQHWHESAGVLVVVFLIPHVGIALWWRCKGAQGRESEASESKS